jgi:TPP-dependent pyruvate/acetoin dehydrogenase alpha subunit
VSTASTLILEAYKIREIERRIIQIYPTDIIQSPLHLSIGQESLAVGVCAHLDAHSQLFTTYRSHAYYLAKGGNLKKFFAELMGRIDGCCEGKGGSMHLADSNVNFMGTSAIVASTIPHAVGAAFANKVQKNDRLVVCVFGDGAVDTGVYHESLNFASLHGLRIVFVVEDNGLAVHTRKEERQAFDLLDHAKSYGLQTYSLEETHHPLAVAELMKNVYKKVMKDEQPGWVLLKTFRYLEHVGTNEDFDIGYRDKREYNSWYQLDPVASFIPSDFEREMIETEIAEAVRFGSESEFPARADLYKDVF